MKRWLIMVVVLALLGWFQACSTASKPEEEGDGSDDPSAQVDPGDPVDTVVVADGINALDEAAETDIDRTSVEAVKSPKTVFKKGQTRFLTADPFFSPGGTNGLDQTTATDGMVRDSAGKSNGDFSAPTSAMPSPTMPGADMAMNEAAGEMAPQDSASPGGVPPAGRVADVEEGDIYKVVGNRLYLLNTYKGFMVVDVSDPKKSKVISRLGVYGYPIEMYVKDDTVHALISDALHIRRAKDGSLYFDRVQQSELVAIDISDEKKPRLLDREPIVGNLMEGKTRKVGDIIYTVSDERNYYFWGWPWEQFSSDGMRTWESRVMVYSFDVGNPDRIEPVGELALIDQEDIDGGFGDFQISATANALMVAKNRWRYRDQNTGTDGDTLKTGIAVSGVSTGTAVTMVDEVDVPPPPDPVEVDPGIPPEEYYQPEERREWCYESENWQESEVSIIDISDEGGAIALYATFELKGMIQDQFKQHYVKNDAGAFYYGLTINQFNKSYWQDAGQETYGHCAYENGTENVLRAVDLTNAKAPKVVDSLAIGKEQETVKASLFQGDATLFAITSRTMDPLYAIDISDPADLTKLSEIDGLNGHISVFRPIEGGDFLLAVGTDTSGTCTGFEDQTWFDSRVAVSIVDVRNLSKLALVDRECLYIEGARGSYSAVTWNYDQAHKMLGIHDTAKLNLITVPASSWIEGGQDAKYPFGHQASVVGAMSWNLTRYLTDPSYKDVLLNRGSVLHPMDEVRRTTIYEAGGLQVGLNISDTWLSFTDFSDLEDLKLYGTLELTANTVDVFAFGDYLVKQVVHGDYYIGAYNGEMQGNEFRIVPKGAGADEAAAVASFSSGPLSKVVQAGNLLLLFRNYWDEVYYDKPYSTPPSPGIPMPVDAVAVREGYFLAQESDEALKIDPYEGSERTEVVIYDLSDPKAPKKRGTTTYKGYLPFYNNYLYGGWNYGFRDVGLVPEGQPQIAMDMAVSAPAATPTVATRTGLKTMAYCLYCGIDQYSTSNYVLLDKSMNFLLSRYINIYYDQYGYGESGSSEGYAGTATTVEADIAPTPQTKFQYREPSETSYNILVSLDFSNPDKPKFHESKRFPQEWFGLVAGADGHSLYLHSQEKSDESEIEQLSYYLYYVRKIDVTDPASPVVGKPINIPGTLNKVFLEDDEERFLTTWYQYYKLTAKADFLGELPYYSQRSMHLLRVENDEAELLSSFLLNDWYVKSMAITPDNRIFLVTQMPYYLLAYHLGDNYQYRSYEHLTILQVKEDGIIGRFNDDLKTMGASIMTVEDASMFLNLEGNGVVVVDVANLMNPVPRKFLRTMGWLNSILVEKQFAYIPAGMYGLYTFDHSLPELLDLAVVSNE